MLSRRGKRSPKMSVVAPSCSVEDIFEVAPPPRSRRKGSLTSSSGVRKSERIRASRGTGVRQGKRVLAVMNGAEKEFLQGTARASRGHHERSKAILEHIGMEGPSSSSKRSPGPDEACASDARDKTLASRPDAFSTTGSAARNQPRHVDLGGEIVLQNKRPRFARTRGAQERGIIDVDALPRGERDCKDGSMCDSVSDADSDDITTARRRVAVPLPLLKAGVTARMKCRDRRNGEAPPSRIKRPVLHDVRNKQVEAETPLKGVVQQGRSVFNRFAVAQSGTTSIPAIAFYGKCGTPGNTQDVPGNRDRKKNASTVSRLSLSKLRIHREKDRGSFASGVSSRLLSSEANTLSETVDRDARLQDLNPEERKEVRSVTLGVTEDQVISEIKNGNIVLRGSDIVRLRGRRWLNDEVMNAFAALINSRNAEYYKGVKITDSRGGEPPKSSDLHGYTIDDDCAIVEPDRVRPGRPRAYMFNSFFFTRLFSTGYDYDGVRRWTTRAGIDVRSLGLLLFPVNLSNYHWVLAAIDMRHREFVYFDSMQGKDSHSVVPTLRRWLADEIADKHGKEASSEMCIENWETVDYRSYFPKQMDEGSCGVFILYMADYLELGKTPDFAQKDIDILRQRTVLYLKNAELPAA